MAFETSLHDRLAELVDGPVPADAFDLGQVLADGGRDLHRRRLAKAAAGSVAGIAAVLALVLGAVTGTGSPARPATATPTVSQAPDSQSADPGGFGTWASSASSPVRLSDRSGGITQASISLQTDGSNQVDAVQVQLSIVVRTAGPVGPSAGSSVPDILILLQRPGSDDGLSVFRPLGGYTPMYGGQALAAAGGSIDFFTDGGDYAAQGTDVAGACVQITASGPYAEQFVDSVGGMEQFVKSIGWLGLNPNAWTKNVIVPGTTR